MSWGLAHGLLPTPLWAAPEIPGAPQSEPIVLVGATLHPISGPPIPAGMLLFEEGRIVALGKMIKLPPRTRRIELKGKHVYPALFDAPAECRNACQLAASGPSGGRIGCSAGP
jgi:hypothetical protein